MNKVLKKLTNVFLIFMVTVLSILIVMAAHHHIKLKIDKPKIKATETLVEIDGYHMNVYMEGEKETESEPTIVLLSGSGVAAPIWDYKVLYSKLSGDYKVAVVEKYGYGYSDISGFSRDVATMVEENREALKKAGERAPYVLMPHSMSALEAIYWAHTYPEEVRAIIGLDMAVPASYDKDNITSISLMKAGVFFGFHRFKLFNPVSGLELSEGEYEQHKLLNYQNALNTDVYNECKMVLKNADTVRNMDISDIPVLMFTTNLGNRDSNEKWSGKWITAQDDFASNLNSCVQIKLDCGHNLHYYKSDEISATIIEFLDGIDKVGLQYEY